MTVLVIGALILGFFVSGKVLGILAIYLLANIAYSLRLKHVVILDVFIIGLGLYAAHSGRNHWRGDAPSQWLLLCGLMMALFLGFAKRRAELMP